MPFYLAKAQNVGIGTTTPQAGLHLQSNNGILATGTIFEGDQVIPSGVGTRLLWYPGKAAFRAGHVIAERWDDENIGEYSVALGYNTLATSFASTALSGGMATGVASIAIGASAESIGDHSFAFGWLSKSTGHWSVAVGREAQALGTYSIALGYNALASGIQSNALGWAKATGAGSTALGTGEASALNSTAIGFITFASGNYSTAIGRQSTASGLNAIVVGHNSHASGVNSIAIGSSTVAGAEYATALGRSTFANGISSTALGYSTTALGENSTAMGLTTTASGENSTAMGFLTSASGSTAIAMGVFTHASGSASTTMGANTTATGYASTSLGFESLASADYATAAGRNSTASGIHSTATGYLTTASGESSTAMGHESVASGNTATSLGKLTQSNGTGTVAMGIGTQAQPLGCVSLGMYNTNVIGSSTTWVGNNPILIVGNGQSDNIRSTALTILKNGNVGIGVTSPSNKLQVAGTVFASDITTSGTVTASTVTCGQFISADHSASATIQLKTSGTNTAFVQLSNDDMRIGTYSGNSDGRLIFRLNGGNRVFVTPSGDVGIGVETPSTKLHVNGNVTATCGVLTCSDARYKTDIVPLTGTLTKVGRLQPVYYHWDTESFPDKGFSAERTIGILAQDLQKEYPELVYTDNTGFMTVDYPKLSAVLLAAINELKAENDLLRTQVDALNTLQSEVAEIRALLQGNTVH